MLCEKCGKKMATTHIKRVINGVSSEMHLCSECASKEGIGGISDNGFGGMLASIFGDSMLTETNHTQKRCEFCGSTISDISQNGKVGCPECYKTFYNELLPYIKRVHGSVKHVGKMVNATSESDTNSTDTLSSLKEKLAELVKAEKFEEAAEIRDRIKEMEGNK